MSRMFYQVQARERCEHSGLPCVRNRVEDQLALSRDGEIAGAGLGNLSEAWRTRSKRDDGGLMWH